MLEASLALEDEQTRKMGKVKKRAGRGYTLDSEVSRIIASSHGGFARRVNVIRGAKAEEVQVTR